MLLRSARLRSFLVPSRRRALYGKIQQFSLRLFPKISPHIAPAMKSGARTLNITKYCACRDKWMDDWSLSHMKPLATRCVLQHHQLLRLPSIASANAKAIRPMIRAGSDHELVISRARPFAELPCPISATRFVWKNATFRAPAVSQCCACHEKVTRTQKDMDGWCCLVVVVVAAVVVVVVVVVVLCALHF